MNLTTTNSPQRESGRTVSERDPWDDDAWFEEEPGPSWSKSYVGDHKQRQYTVY